MTDIRVSQAALIEVADLLAPDISVSQAALVMVIQPHITVTKPTAIKLPCQTNCLQFFDLRKRA